MCLCGEVSSASPYFTTLISPHKVKLVVLLYYQQTTRKRNLKNNSIFTIASKAIKYFGINLTKELKYLCTENGKKLIKEIEDTNRKISHVHGFKELILLQMSVLPKVIYRFIAIPIQTPMAFFPHRNRKKILIFIWNHKKPERAKPILTKKNKAGVISF